MLEVNGCEQCERSLPLGLDIKKACTEPVNLCLFENKRQQV